MSILHRGRCTNIIRYSPSCQIWKGYTCVQFGHTLQYQSSNITSTTCKPPQTFLHNQCRYKSTNSPWIQRQRTDIWAKEAKIKDLKSRAAFKLLQINDRYRLFRPGMTVVDLGFAPGSWSQVAIDLVRPGIGRVLGVDLLPIAPPKGVNAIQGDFLNPEVQDRIRTLLKDENIGRAKSHSLIEEDAKDITYLDDANTQIADGHDQKCVDMIISDMSAPWQPIAVYARVNVNRHFRMMNTSGNKFKDHVNSMDLCRSALYFAYDTLKIGGHFVCKFYQGSEDIRFEKQLKAMFTKVHREKPESSRSESRESFFICIKRLAKVDGNAVFDEGS